MTVRWHVQLLYFLFWILGMQGILGILSYQTTLKIPRYDILQVICCAGIPLGCRNINILRDTHFPHKKCTGKKRTGCKHGGFRKSVLTNKGGGGTRQLFPLLK